MTLSLILFAIIGKKTLGNWESPFFLAGLLWMFYILIAYIFMRRDYSFSMSGIAWVYIAFWAMLYAENLACRNTVKVSQKIDGVESVSSQSWLYIKVCFALGMCAFFYQVSLYGFGINDFVSLNELASMNNKIAVARYSGEGIVNGLTQILLVFIYAAPACGGYAFLYCEKKCDRIWSMVTLLPAIMMVLLTNTKAVIIGACVFWASAYWVSYFSRYKRSVKISLRTVLILVAIGVCFLSFLVFSMVLRIGEISQSAIEVVQKKFQVYAFGSIQSFDWWCGNIYEPEYRLGVATYLGLFNFLGLAKKIQGVYTTYIGGTVSNVFTVFRGVIEDYGYFGGILYLAIKAFICGLCIKKIYKSSNIKPLATTFLVAQIFFLVFGFFVSPWTYMSYIVAIIVFAGYLFSAKSKSVRIKILR